MPPPRRFFLFPCKITDRALAAPSRPSQLLHSACAPPLAGSTFLRRRQFPTLMDVNKMARLLTWRGNMQAVSEREGEATWTWPRSRWRSGAAPGGGEDRSGREERTVRGKKPPGTVFELTTLILLAFRHCWALLGTALGVASSGQPARAAGSRGGGGGCGLFLLMAAFSRGQGNERGPANTATPRWTVSHELALAPATCGESTMVRLMSFVERVWVFT